MNTRQHSTAKSIARFASSAATIACLVTLNGCAHNHADHAEACPACSGESTKAALAPKPASASVDQQLMSRFEALEGEWESQDAEGNWNTAAVFSVSSNGSVVRELMFPGAPHEMTNLYHMDGTNAVVTHYCAIGNQPRMIASEMIQTDDGPAIEFGFDSVSNLRPDHATIMGTLRVVFVDDNHIRQDWTAMTPDGETANEMTFNLRRKQ